MPLHVSSTIVLIVRRSEFYYTASGIITPIKLYYTASGIITPISVMIPEAVYIQFWAPDDEHMVLETCRGMK
jgi:hypothetical protein